MAFHKIESATADSLIHFSFEHCLGVRIHYDPHTMFTWDVSLIHWKYQLKICSTLVYNGFMSPKIGDLEEIILVAIHKSISVEVLTGGLKQGQPPHTPVKDLGLGLRSKKNHCATDIIHQSWIFHRKMVELKYSYNLLSPSLTGSRIFWITS